MPGGCESPAASILVEALKRPGCYPHPVEAVELLETHISWVLLAGRFAYKLKKPVSLGFVDFSTLEVRRFFCQEELRLNRRTAPALYLDVVPITGAPETPAIGGAGPAFEYAVKMRRFAQEALLDRMAKAGSLTDVHIDRFARALAVFHGKVTRAGAAGAYGAPREILAEAVGNLTQMQMLETHGSARLPEAGEERGTGEARRELGAWTLHEFGGLEPLLARRKHDGFVRECHGDLHLGNVVLLDGEPVAFDAIEFNEAFRWIDVMNEVAFPLMDLHYHGRPRLANRFLDAYLAASGDYAGLQVLRFYTVYRSMVRAKVACIRMHQAGSEAAVRERSARSYLGHLELARRLSRPGKAALVLMHGLPGSGKTTASQALLERFGAVRLRSDVERKRLHGHEALARTGSAPGGGLYSAEADRLTYGRLAALAGGILDAGYPAIIDAAFPRQAWREMFRELARERGAAFVIVECTAPHALLRERTAARERQGSDASEAGPAVLERRIALIEPLAAEEQENAVQIDTTGSDVPPAAVASLARRLGIEPA